MKNCFPQTVYNITCIVGAQLPLPMAIEGNDGSLPEDLVFTSNRRRLADARHEAGTGKFACRTHGQAGCPICRSLRTPPRIRPTVDAEHTVEKTQQNEPLRKNLPPATAIDFRAPRQQIAAPNGNDFPQPTENGCREERKEAAVANGNDFPWTTENGCRSERQKVADKGESKDVSLSVSEESFKRSTVGNASKKAVGAKKINAENHFLAEVAWIMDLWKPGHGKFELENSGAWWRQCYRSDADLIERVLAETKSMITEGKIKTTPGQVAVDLWKRWKKDKLNRILADTKLATRSQQKTAATAAART